MRLSLALLSALAIPSIIAANIPVASEYAEFRALCRADPDNVVIVRYATGSPKAFKYEECLHIDDPDDGKAEVVVVCRSTSCNITRNKNCEPGNELPAPVVLPPGVYAPAIQIWAESVVGSSAICKRTALSSVL